MKTMVKLAVLLGGIVVYSFFGCQKDNSPGNEPIPEGQARMSVYLMDDPIPFSQVLIDIRQVAVRVDTGQNYNDRDEDGQWRDDFCGRGRDRHNSSVIWDTLDIRPGVYDLLQLRNGVDTLLASGLIPEGKVLKVRVTLGADNKIVVDSTDAYPLVIFGAHTYFDIDVRKENLEVIDQDQFNLWLDFNLQRSIYFWSGRYYLKPVVKPFNDRKAFRLQGRVLPRGASPLVKAFSDTDTLYALPRWDGYYLIRGVNEGSYSISFTGQHGYRDTTITDITVGGNRGTVVVPAVTLHK